MQKCATDSSQNEKPQEKIQTEAIKPRRTSMFPLDQILPVFKLDRPSESQNSSKPPAGLPVRVRKKEPT